MIVKIIWTPEKARRAGEAKTIIECDQLFFLAGLFKFANKNEVFMVCNYVDVAHLWAE